MQALFDTSLIVHVINGFAPAQRLMDEVKIGRLTAGYSAITAYELWLTKPLPPLIKLQYRLQLSFLVAIPFEPDIAFATAEALREEPRERRGRLFHDAVIAHTAKKFGVPVWTGDLSFKAYGAQVNRYDAAAHEHPSAPRRMLKC